jgi:carboxyl-terminal processing protease
MLRGDDDQHVTVTVIRSSVDVPSVRSDILVAPHDPHVKYSYVQLKSFTGVLLGQFDEHVKAAMKKNPSGFIFDVRRNPGGDLNQVVMVNDKIADSPTPFVLERDNDGVHPIESSRITNQPGDMINGLPCAVLIDEGSASASEIFAGNLKALGRCVIIGKKTFGKGSIQGVSKLSDGSAQKTTFAEYLLVNGRPVQCVGVEADIEYEADADLKSGRVFRDCDLKGATVSGGPSGNQDLTNVPLVTRNPALYAFGVEVLEAVKAKDREKRLNRERIDRLLKSVFDGKEAAPSTRRGM